MQRCLRLLHRPADVFSLPLLRCLVSQISAAVALHLWARTEPVRRMARSAARTVGTRTPAAPFGADPLFAGAAREPPEAAMGCRPMPLIIGVGRSSVGVAVRQSKT